MAAIYLIPLAGLPNYSRKHSGKGTFRQAGAKPGKIGALPRLAAFPPRPHVVTMAILDILEFPDARLRTKARPLAASDFTPALQKLVDDMFETMYAAPGIGLAASQVDVHLRFMVIDVSEEKNAPLVFVNPEIVAHEGSQVHQEGCLSVPGVYADVSRHEQIVVRALDRHGEPFELAADGLLAVCIQHEMDHLEGRLFVDYLSPLKREMVKRRLLKQRRAA
jgi:peptide deformylase